MTRRLAEPEPIAAAEDLPGFDRLNEVGPARSRRRMVAAVVIGSVLLVAAALLLTSLVARLAEPPSDGSRVQPAGDAETKADRRPLPREVWIDELKPGDCFDQPPVRTADDAVLDKVTLLGCDGPHDAEVFALADVPPPSTAPYPSEGEWAVLLEDACEPHFQRYVGHPYQRSRLWRYSLIPDEPSWAEGDRWVVCTLRDSGARLEQSIADNGAAFLLTDSGGDTSEPHGWSVLVGALLLFYGHDMVLAVRRRLTAERLRATVVSREFGNQGWDCLVDVTLRDGAVRRLPLRADGTKPSGEVAVKLKSDADVAVLASPRGGKVVPVIVVVLGGAILVGGLSGEYTLAGLLGH